MAHQLNIFFLLFGAVQGGLISFFLLRHKKKDHSQIFLTLFLVVVGLQLTFKVITKVWLMENVNMFYNLSYSLPYLTGPLIYLFIRARLTQYRFSSMDLFHFAPYAILLITYLRAYVARTHYVDVSTVWLLNPYVELFLKLAFLISYAFMSWRILQKSQSGIRSGLTQFLIFATTAEAIIIVTMTLLLVNYGNFPDVRLLFLVLTLVIYWISYKLIAQPDLFLAASGNAAVVPMKVDNNASKYAHSGLKPEDAEKIVTSLNEAMVQKKVYIDPDLSIEKLAGSLNISRHHLSQVLNERFQRSYFDFVNGFRIEEARQRLAEQKYAHFTIAAIALDSGFSSVSSFNETFKKQFGVTPSKFREASRKKMSA
jgi:AraC-like DNA-binding protein